MIEPTKIPDKVYWEIQMKIENVAKAAILRLVADAWEKCGPGDYVPDFFRDEAERYEKLDQTAEEPAATTLTGEREGLGSVAAFKKCKGCTSPLTCNNEQTCVDSMWQAEAQASQSRLTDAQLDAILTGPTPKPGAVISIDGHRYAYVPEAQAPQADADGLVQQLRAGCRRVENERDALKEQLGGQNQITVDQAVQITALKAGVSELERERVAQTERFLAEARSGEALGARVARLEEALRKIEHVWTVKPLPDPDRPGYFIPVYGDPIKETLTLVRAALAGDKTNV